MAPSLIMTPPPVLFLNEAYIMIYSKLNFSHLKQNNFINGTQNMLFHNLICCFPVVFTLFYPKYEFKFAFSYF